MKTKAYNPWPVAITAFFILAVIFLVGFVIWAIGQREDLVSADYYEREVRFQLHLDKLNRSQSFARETIVAFEPEKQVIVVMLPPEQSCNVTGKIHLYRPSDARLDFEVPLTPDIEGRQRIDAKELALGLWKVRVSWSANGQAYFRDQAVNITSG
jgi:hypothetical protein